MKAAYVTAYNASDVHSWSGIPAYMSQASTHSGFNLEYIGDLAEAMSFLFKAKTLFYRKLMRQNYFRDREPSILDSYAKQIGNALVHSDSELVFSPGTIPIAHLETDKPIVFWTDATFASLVDFYPDYSNLCAETLRKGHQMEREALSRCRLAIYSSHWAAKSAIRDYGVDPEKVKVVPFGANIECSRNREDIARITARKDFRICKLLLVGVDWFRKGGDMALRVAERLNQQGVETELHVVGCSPPVEPPDFVTLHGYVSKKTEAGVKTLNRVFSESHFFILPSRAECYGIVLAEASSFGLPCLATHIGGIPTAVSNGKNGWTFSLDANPDDYCEYIARYMAAPLDYAQLAASTFEHYAEKLNWLAAGQAVRNLVHESCK
jgi:glycosyltransferase involved in cell wall biosynthesis